MSKVADWLEYISRRNRPELHRALSQLDYNAELLQDTPGAAQDKGHAITLLLPDKSTGRVYWFFSEVVKGYKYNSKDRTNTEVYGSATISGSKLLDMLGLTPVEQAEQSSRSSATSEQKERNERGAGRRPLNYDLQRQIIDCISSGKSIRATAKELNLSTRTVQKYAKLLSD